jgi:cytochrome c
VTSVRSSAAVACFLGLVAGLASARADVEKGKIVFEKCAACHSLEANKNDVAPTLAGVFGRKAGTLEEYRYSAAMKQSDVTWDDRTLDAFIEDPQAFIPGNRMPFDGLKDKTDREDLLAYLKVATKKSDNAHSLPWLILQWQASKGSRVKDMVALHQSHGRKSLSLAKNSSRAEHRCHLQVRDHQPSVV